jgi:hypothetical protein
MIKLIPILFLIFFPSLLLASDLDRDGLDDETERKIGTSLTSQDSDSDGSKDGDEVNYQTNPSDPNQKIIKIGESKPTGRRYVSGNGFFSKGWYEPTGYEREVVVSLNGKTESKIVNNNNLFHSRQVYLFKLEDYNRQKELKTYTAALLARRSLPAAPSYTPPAVTRYTPPVAPRYTPPVAPRYTPPVAENGSYYGQLNSYGVRKTVKVSGYYRKNGTYVRGHYRSR